MACDHGWEVVDADLSAAKPGCDIEVSYEHGEHFVYSFVSEVKGSQLNTRTQTRRPLRRLAAPLAAQLSTKSFLNNSESFEEKRDRLAGQFLPGGDRFHVLESVTETNTSAHSPPVMPTQKVLPKSQSWLEADVGHWLKSVGLEQITS